MADDTPEGYDEAASYASELDEAEDDIEDEVYLECNECEGEGCDVCDDTGEWQCTHNSASGTPVGCDICADEIWERHEARRIKL
jgi:hypothetical protein